MLRRDSGTGPPGSNCPAEASDEYKDEEDENDADAERDAERHDDEQRGRLPPDKPEWYSVV